MNMKILKYILSVLILTAFVSCEKNVIEYDTTPISDVAEFQLHYFVPVTAVATNNIYKVVVNDQLYANNTAPLATYNAIPNGAVGKFYRAPIGSQTIKLYQGQGATEKLVYEQPCHFVKGKQNVFVYDFAKPPVVFDNGYPYTTNVTENTDSTCWVKFYNFLYETDGVYTNLKLQYQYVDPRTKEVKNIGQPVAFGETTGWVAVKVIKTDFNSAGSCRIDYKAKVVDASGVVTGDLQIMNSKGVYAPYADYWTEFIGRRYHHVISGMRSSKTITAATRQFTAL